MYIIPALSRLLWNNFATVPRKRLWHRAVSWGPPGGFDRLSGLCASAMNGFADAISSRGRDAHGERIWLLLLGIGACTAAALVFEGEGYGEYGRERRRVGTGS